MQQQGFDPEMMEGMSRFASGVGLVGVLVGLVIGIAIAVVICLILQSCYKRIPAEYRQLDPGLVWLLLIPCVPLVWNFWVFPKLAASFKGYFDAQGITDVGDCGATLALVYCIVTACCIVPCVNYLAGPASLVLLIILLVKFNGMKNRIPEARIPGM